MRVVVALGGNALLRRGEPLSIDAQRANVAIACEALVPIAREHELVITHGNGPQVGLLALQSAAYAPADPVPLDVLDAQTEGMVGYLIEQELRNLLPSGAAVATLLTIIEVDGGDPAFDHPTKPIGPLYDRPTADRLVREKGWTFAADGDRLRRVVPSPQPQRILGLRQIECLLADGCVVVCTGGGGIPAASRERRLEGVEGVIDKDRASALLAGDLCADVLIIATDVDAVYDRFGRPDQRAVRRASPAALRQQQFAEGSMGPKVEAACAFAERSGCIAVIGALGQASRMLRGESGTTVDGRLEGIEYEARGRELRPGAPSQAAV